MLSKKAIKEFKEIYKRECGRRLADAKAVELATSLVNLMRVVYRPIPKTYGKNEKS